MPYYGRKKILTDQAEITAQNVLSVLQTAMTIHAENRREIEYLWDYYRGNQPIRNRKKETRPEIMNIVAENHAQEIVDFKVGYLVGEPVQYVSRTDGSDTADEINKLNAYVISEDKAEKDRDLVEWNHICGTAYRMVLPDKDRGEDEAPFEVYTLDPRNSFVVRLNDLGEPVVMGVKYVTRANGVTVYSCYTDDSYFEIEDGDSGMKVVAELPNSLGIPIIEYPANNARMGAFEPVLDLLDGINNVQSNRLDGLEQFVQALMLFHNVDIDSEQWKELREEGAIKVKDPDPQMQGEVKYLVEELNQTQTQTVKNDMYEAILVICGMPNRNGGSSTSDTGAAVVMRDGWSAAETRAKASEGMFKRSERAFLKKVLLICKDLSDLKLKQSNIEIRFTRRNYENITEKATVLTQMLSCEKIAPQLAFSHCGMFADPETAYQMSKKYEDEQKREAELNAQKQSGADPGGNPGNPRDPAERQARGNRTETGQNRDLGNQQ